MQSRQEIEARIATWLDQCVEESGARQMQANPFVEISGLIGKGKQFFRYYGRAVFEESTALSELALNQPGYPIMKKIYTKESGHRFAVFHLEDATAEKRAMMAVLERYHL